MHIQTAFSVINDDKNHSHPLHEENQYLPEELDEVDEEVERVPDGVLVAPAALLDDGLGVVDHEAAEDEEAAPQVQLEQGGAPATGRRMQSQSFPEGCTPAIVRHIGKRLFSENMHKRSIFRSLHSFFNLKNGLPTQMSDA